MPEKQFTTKVRKSSLLLLSKIKGKVEASGKRFYKQDFTQRAIEKAIEREAKKLNLV